MANEFRVRKKLIVNGSGSVILDVQGSQGQLFSVTDSLSGSLFSVKDISGIPVIEAFSDDTVNIGTFNAEAIKVSGSFARITGSLLGSASYALTASYAMNGGGTPIDTSAFATTGSNTFRGNQTVTGSLFTSGSNTLVGVTTLTGSLLVTGSTTQTGNNTLVGNTTLSGSIIISGSSTPGSPTASVQIYGDIRQTGYHRFDPVSTNINSSISASYIYVSGSTNDLYFSQNGVGYSNTTRLRWLEGNLYTGLLHGGLITATVGSTTYQISSGSGIIVNLNASLANDPYPTIQFLEWGNLTGNISPLTASYQQAFVSIDSTGNIYQQGTPYAAGQYDTEINIGIVLFQNGSTINGVKTQPSTAYGFEQQQNIFNRAFGPLKLSGYTLAPSASSVGSLIVAGGTAYSPGSNYPVDPNNPSYATDNGTNVSKIFRYRQSGSTWVYDTNGGAGYTAIDPTQYSNNGVLTAVPGGGSNREWSIQRVFWFPNSVAKAIVVYYGNAVYTTQTDATSNIPYEPFVEAPNTAANAIYLGAIVVRNNADFTVNASYNIQPGGLFRQVGGSGGGGSVVTQTLSGLSDVSISAPTNGQALVYDTTAAKWQNKSSISASISGNATTATTAATASSADNFTVRGTLTAQTIVAQTITSSTDYVSGSTIFGNSLSNTHQFTGSVSITGSSHYVLGNIGIGTTSPSTIVDIRAATNTSVVPLNGSNLTGISLLLGNVETNGVGALGQTNVGQFYIQSRSRLNNGTAGQILLNPLGGNVTVGATTDTGERFQVSGSSRFVGNMVITGSGNTSATNAFLVQNSVLSSSLVVRNDGSTLFAGSTGAAGTWIDQNGTAHIFRSINGATYGLRVYNGAGWSGHNGILAIAYAYPMYGSQGSNGSEVASPLDAGAGVLGKGGVGVYGLGVTPSGDNGSIGVMATTLFVNNSSNTTLYDRNTSVHIVGTNQTVLRVSSGTVSNILFVTSSGNVGISTTTPAYKLDVSGSVGISGPTVLAGAVAINSTNVSSGYALFVNGVIGSSALTLTQNLTVGENFAISNNGSQTIDIDANNNQTDAIFRVTSNGTANELFRVDESGSFMIGKITSNAKLDVSGSAIISGSLTATQGITGSLFGTSSWANNAVSTSFASTASSADNFTVRGTLTAQTIVAQTITSSTDFVSGSTIFGNILSNTHQFTGSVSITGSLTLPYLSTGSVLFAGATDNIAEDNTNFFWDNTNKRLGIGTSSGITTFNINTNSSTTYSATAFNGVASGFRITNGSGGVGRYSGISFAGGNNTEGFFGVVQNASSLAEFVFQTFNGSTYGERVRITSDGSIGIGTTSPSFRLDVSGSSRFAGNMVITGSANITQALTASAALISGSGTQRLVVVGSGSAQPLFTVQGSQGELFSIVDSLSGSLFSVNDQSGLPIMEVFSDNTILMGNYLDPMLLTTTRTGSAAGINTLYTLPTSSYDAVYIDYTIRSGSNARAGNFMAMWSGTSVNFTDNSITEFGTTSGFTFGAHVTGSNMIVTGSSPTAGWTVKTIIKAI